MGSIDFPKTMVRNYHYLLHNIAEEQSSKKWACLCCLHMSTYKKRMQNDNLNITLCAWTVILYLSFLIHVHSIHKRDDLSKKFMCFFC